MMTSPNMATITASLQNCSLSNHQRGGTSAGIAPQDGDGFSDSSENHTINNNPSDDATLELNSEVSLPYHWEQCLDLKVQYNVIVVGYYNNFLTFILLLTLKAQILDFDL